MAKRTVMAHCENCGKVTTWELMGRMFKCLGCKTNYLDVDDRNFRQKNGTHK